MSRICFPAVAGWLTAKSHRVSSTDGATEQVEPPAEANVNSSRGGAAGTPTRAPLSRPTAAPSEAPAAAPTASPTEAPTEAPTTPAPTPAPTPAFDYFNPKTPEYDLEMGPMVGHTTSNSTIIWASDKSGWANANIEISLHDQQGNEVKTQTVTPERNLWKKPLKAKIDGLQPKTWYVYTLKVNGKLAGEGRFKTAPPELEKAKFSYILTSCMRTWEGQSHQKIQPAWNAALIRYEGASPPDFNIQAGDTIYLKTCCDFGDDKAVKIDKHWERSLEQRNVGEWKNFVRQVPTYSTWDDHDFGWNNADKNQRNKQDSLKAWESLWANPGFGDASSEDGIYYSYYWGDVHFIVLDNMWERDGRANTQLGSKQREWLLTELKNSKGVFKVIVLGGDITTSSGDEDLKAIGQTISANKINGVVFHSGDIHRNLYKLIKEGDAGWEPSFPYPIHMIISSGIGKHWKRPFAQIRIDTQQADPLMRVRMYATKHDSMIKTTPEKMTWSNSEYRCTEKKYDDFWAQNTCTQKTYLSELTVPR